MMRKTMIMRCAKCEGCNTRCIGGNSHVKTYECQDCRNRFSCLTDIQIFSPELLDAPYVLRDKTFEKYGYYPENLKPLSRNPIWVACPLCKEERPVRRSVYVKSDQPCQNCVRRERFRAEASKKKIYESAKHKSQVYQKRKLSTLEGATTHRLRVLLRRSLTLKGFKNTNGCFKILGYDRLEFVKHIQSCFQEGCCICLQNIKVDDKWDIAHKIPVFEAKTVDEVYQAFNLQNLHIAHRICNQKLNKKRVDAR